VVHEADLPQPWSARGLPPEFKANLLKAIVGFEMVIDRVEGKFKFGQNRPIEDQLATLDELTRSSTVGDRKLADLIRAHQALTHR
jgi:transcriptional regulator